MSVVGKLAVPRAAPVDDTHERVLREGIRRAEEAIRAKAPLRTALAFLTSVVEQLSHQKTVASVLILDKQGLLRNGASPNLPADYLAAIDRIRPDPELGTCAAAAARGERILTLDFKEDSRWAELRHLPLSIGFVAAWSEPIKSAGTGRVLGTFGTYFHETRGPTPLEVQVVEALVPVAARAIEAVR